MIREHSSTCCARKDLTCLYFIDSKRLIMAERVGFGLLLVVEPKNFREFTFLTIR
jgi:hypothetical protein